MILLFISWKKIFCDSNNIISLCRYYFSCGVDSAIVLHLYSNHLWCELALKFQKVLLFKYLWPGFTDEA